MTTTIYVPCDASALSLGAEATAREIAAEAQRRGAEIRLVRNGTRGMLWLEPMVEVETAGGRVAYGPVKARDVAGLFDAGFLRGGTHALALGAPADHPYLKNQERLTFARVGITDPLSLDDYLAHGGYRGLPATVRALGSDHRYIPPKRYTWQSDVETVHRLVEDEFFDREIFHSPAEFWAKTTTYWHYFNLARPNRGKEWQTPLQIIERSAPKIHPAIGM